MMDQTGGNLAKWRMFVREMRRHPLTADRPIVAFKRFVRWQMASRLAMGPVAVPFVNGSRLLVDRGMASATGNIYTGLRDFQEMSFLLHLLRPGDLFVDVGANVGTYTVLASAACGAESIACEPVPATFTALVDNVNLNRVSGLVEVLNVAVGDEPGQLEMSNDLGTRNHIVAPQETKGKSIVVPVSRLDDIVGSRKPIHIKIDVEGFEPNVIRGGEQVLSDTDLQAVQVEFMGHSSRYGQLDTENHQKMLEFGFSPATYDANGRVLSLTKGTDSDRRDTLYVRDIDLVSERLQTSVPFSVLGAKV